jgi:L-threonylcarbamoyladenylate synthase
VKTEIAAATANHARQDQNATARAVELLKRGEVVALPTETVYGLAANALQPAAVVKIFEAKERPRFDPLIVHLPDITWLERVANISTENRELVTKLTKAFWPGPFTVILPKTDLIPDLVTSGLDTIAVRMSAHLVFSEIIQAFGSPLAAPSANRFGRISPTTAEHAMQELGGRISLIVDAGPTIHGLESTVVAIGDGEIQILRPGPITEDDLRRGIGFQPMIHRPAADATTAPAPRAPGQLPSHYAPATPLQLVDDARSLIPQSGQRIGLLGWQAPSNINSFGAIRILSDKQDLGDAAVNLFRYLRELDEANLDLIWAELVPEKGLGVAINDRLRRAAAR